MPATLDIPRQMTIQTLQQMRDDLQALLTEADNYRAQLDGLDRDWTPEENAAYQALVERIEDAQLAYSQEQRRIEREGRREQAASMRQEIAAIPVPGQLFTSTRPPTVSRMRHLWRDDAQWGFKGHGDFALAVYNSTVLGMRDERLERIQQYQAAMDHNIPSQGGMLLPPAHNTTIYNHMLGSRTNLMAVCDRYPLTGNLTIELIANAETSRSPGSRWGGVQSYWVEDGTQMTESNPKTRILELRPRQLATLVKVTNTLLSNSSALEAFLDQAAADDQIQTINNAIMRGDGVAKPRGFLNSGSLVTILKETSQAGGTIVDMNVHKMWARVIGEEETLWLVNRDAVPQIEGMPAPGVSGNTPVMLATQNGWPTMAIQGPQTLKGRPIRRVEQCSTVGTIGDIILANMSGYALAYRARDDSAGTIDGEPAIQKDMSMHLEFDRNRTAFRYLISVDGQPWLQQAITPEQGTSTLSHFVVIETRT